MTRIIRTPAGTQPEHDNFPSRPKSHSQAQRPQDVEAEIDFHPPPTHQSESTTQTLPYPPSVLQSLTLLSSTTTSPKTHTTHIIPPAHGHAFYLGPNKSFRIVDLHGQQVVDLMAWTSPGDPSGQHTSMSYTRYNLSGSAPPIVSEHIYSNLGQPFLQLKTDTVRCHDMLFMACNPSFYAGQGLKGHRNCAENISGEVTRLVKGKGIGWNEIIDPFNVFQNTPYYSLKALGCSKAGDYCEFENVLGKTVVVGLSCCPFEGDGFNGGKVTEVAVVVEV